MDTTKKTLIANLGAGTMGCGTALFFALRGCAVHLFGNTPDHRKQACARIQLLADQLVQDALLSHEQTAAALRSIKECATIEEAVAGAEYILEAIPESLALKQKLWAEAEQFADPHAVLATNTSGLSPSAISRHLTHRDRFLGLHFFNPPYLIPLVELIPARNTRPELVNRTWKFMEQLGQKTIVLNKELPGFISNRLYMALLREALYLVEERVASPEDIDSIFQYAIGRRLSETGPLAAADLAGLDVILAVSSYINSALSNAAAPSYLLEEAIQQGRLGVKTGVGLYQWEPKQLTALLRRRNRTLATWLSPFPDTQPLPEV